LQSMSQKCVAKFTRCGSWGDQYPSATPSLRDSVAPKYTSFSASYQIAW
jgi:hypothetical protein